MRKLGWDWVDGILLDLGVSSMQMDTPERGFSFQYEAPLDMRFNPDSGLSAGELINSLHENDLAELFFKYGEEPRAKRLAKMIVHDRPVSTTTQLADIAKRVYPEYSRIHPATRLFQALRIAVNDELTAVQNVLPLAAAALRPGGRLAVISFHSLEDRFVKEFIRRESKDQINPPYEQIYKVERKAILKEINRKPITPDDEEIKENPRARSAKLRIAEKI
jgi:16S rRNA (cytosine1402-N4)-methyltransferase